MDSFACAVWEGSEEAAELLIAKGTDMNVVETFESAPFASCG